MKDEQKLAIKANLAQLMLNEIDTSLFIKRVVKICATEEEEKSRPITPLPFRPSLGRCIGGAYAA